MPEMIAQRSMYYAGTRKPEERFYAPAALALAFVAMGQARYAEDEGEAVKPKKRRTYKRRDMQAGQ